MTEFEKLTAEVAKLREEVRVIRSCIKWLVIMEKLRGCGFRTDDERAERMALMHQLPALPKTIFDADKVAKEVYAGRVRTKHHSEIRDRIIHIKMQGKR